MEARLADTLGIPDIAFALTLSPWVVRNQFNAEVAAVGVASSPLLRHVLDEGEQKHTIANMGPKFDAVFAEAEERGIERGSLQFELNTLRLLRDRITRSPSAYVAYLWDTFSRFWMEPPAVWPYAVYNSELYPWLSGCARVRQPRETTCRIRGYGIVVFSTLLSAEAASRFLHNCFPFIFCDVPHDDTFHTAL